MKVDDFETATAAIEVALIVAGALAGNYAWSPYLVGALIGTAIGLGVAYIVVDILVRLYVIYSDPARLDRELDEARRRRDEERRGRK